MNKKQGSDKHEDKYAGIEKARLEEIRKQIPPEYVQRRAAHIWRRMMGDPQFKIEVPGEETVSGSMASVLASMAAGNVVPAESSYQVFEDKLTELLMEPWVLEACDGGRRWVRAIVRMEVDYHPDEVLAAAAAHANISVLRFPFKTSIWTHPSYDKKTRPYVSVAAGYRSDAVHHYPVFIKDKRPQGWLMTMLQGADMAGLLNHIETVYTPGHVGRIMGVGEIEWVI